MLCRKIIPGRGRVAGENKKENPVVPSRSKTFVYHLYNVGPASKTLGRRCTNVMQMFCVCWVMPLFLLYFIHLCAITKAWSIATPAALCGHNYAVQVRILRLVGTVIRFISRPYPQEILLAQFSLYEKMWLKADLLVYFRCRLITHYIFYGSQKH